MWHEARYLLRAAAGDLRRAPFVHVAAALTIGLSLFLAGLFGAVVVNLSRLLEEWGADVQLSVYLDDGASEARIVSAVSRELGGVPATLVGKAEALDRLRRSLGDLAGALDGLGEDPLPRSVEARPLESMDAGEVRAAAVRIGKLPGVTEVDYGKDWLERLEALLGLLRAVGTALGGLVIVAAVLLVSSAIQLSVYARRDEIEIMKLVGATDWYVRTPFLIEGLVQGLAGAALAAGGLWLCNLALGARVREALTFAAGLADASVFTAETAGILAAAGVALGLLGSAAAVARFLKT